MNNSIPGVDHNQQKKSINDDALSEYPSKAYDDSIDPPVGE
jgi:hypothetical protein